MEKPEKNPSDPKAGGGGIVDKVKSNKSNTALTIFLTALAMIIVFSLL